MKTRIAINGFGRIGRLAFRLMADNPNFEIVVINDLADAETMAYLLKYDSTQGNFGINDISFSGNALIYKNTTIAVTAIGEIEKLPWAEKQVDIVFECTGRFTKREDLEKHIASGAKRVILSAPAKGDDVPTIVYGANHTTLTHDDKIISAASCTTNCLAPVVKVINEAFGIEKGYVTTVHAYTSDQSLVDSNHKKGIRSRRGRAAALNIVPSSTGAAKAIGLVIPELKGKLDGAALRVPTAAGSIINLVVEFKRHVTVEEINEAIKANVNEAMGYTEDPIVSSDIVGNTHGGVYDASTTTILEVNGQQMITMLIWYDNEMSYTAQMIRVAEYIAELR